MPSQRPSSDAVTFFLSVFSSILGLLLLLFIVVMIPYIFFNATSTVPDFIVDISHWLEDHNDLRGFSQRIILLIPFVLTSGILFFISWYTTRILEKKDKDLARLHEKAIAENKDEEEMIKADEEKMSFLEKHPGLLIFSLLLIVISLLVLVEYLIGTDII